MLYKIKKTTLYKSRLIDCGVSYSEQIHHNPQALQTGYL